ncbi:MAG: right-handed parallel beta-helix repeat-containing protein, partial [Candidatus Heimdallarchaeota archaeon]|nr:right-handed parallel beta-helix repeat-containing protein [Candidatus Heimdallarchaeota archaeon]MCK4955429.1 right-handed parallel beta-helix repeat-containing protein [Candidatus Heimdallarchaeota archaeon]
MSKEKFFLFRPRVLVLTIVTLIIVTAILTPPIVIWKKRAKPIIIQSDEDFVKYNFLGEGTAENPYLIQNKEILTSDYCAIEIGNVTKHFIIQNNNLKSNRYSIFLAITTSNIAKIINNTLEGEEAGIFITATPGCKIINNTFRNLHSGIGIFTLNDEINDYYVINNTFENIQYEEIIIVKSGNSIIENNTCTYENQEENQDIRKRGIFIINSPNVTIRNNYLTNKGITLSDNTLEAYLTKTV